MRAHFRPTTLSLLAVALATAQGLGEASPNVLVELPEPLREVTAQDVERIEAARVKRSRKAARRGGVW